MRKLFGTDGIRGPADEFPLDDATMVALGEALAHRLRTAETRTPVILLGMDTRESGPRIARALSQGIRDGGGEPHVIGVVPTPAVAYLCRVTDASAGISISASHNPFRDNGVKVFGHDGMKLSDTLEKEIEDELMALRKDAVESSEPAPTADLELINRYEAFLLEGVPGDALAGCRVVLDTGNGAAYSIAPEVFRKAGAEVTVINDAPDGRNINENAGALHPEGLAAIVTAQGADFGVAFDGDADRAIFVDDRGAIRNGDEILYLWARREKARGTLTADTVVATVMSNFGFEKKLTQDGIQLLRANVGDKYVLESMIASGAILGGEQSGHVIDLQVHTTGDGIHTAMVLARLLAEEHRAFSALETFEPYPQILLNERVAAKPPLDTLPRYGEALSAAQREIEGKGRILVRYSGTENLVRVMVEGDDAAQIDRIARNLASVLRDEIAAAGTASAT